MISCIKITDADAYNASCGTKKTSTFLDRIQLVFPVLHMTTRINKQAGDVCSLVIPPRNTPPQVSRFTCLNGNSKKGGNGSKPGESKPDKSKTEEKEREGDKGKQRVKKPKRGNLASSILQKSRVLSGLGVVVLRWFY